MIYFKDSTHEYVNERGEKYTSVSSLWSKYKNEFDKEKWSNYKAIEVILGESLFKALKAQYSSIEAMLKDVVPQMDPAILESEVKRILQKWSSGSKDAINKGNLYHSSMEKKALITGVVINPFTQTGFKVVKSDKSSGFDNESISMNLLDLKDGFYPELLIWSDKYLIAGQSDKVFISTEKRVRYVDIDDYKGLALDTPIATTAGWKYIKDIEIGDEIFDGDGVPTKVQHVSSIHYNPCYKITFDTNDELICDHEHRWVISNRKSIGIYKDIELDTDSLYKSFLKNKKLRIKCTSLQLSTKDLPIDPYVLGLWLADGNRCANTITCQNQEIWNEIENRGYKTSINHNRNHDKCESRTIFGLRDKLVDLNLLQNKHIPEIYLRSSHNQRLDLLRGLMDGDGYFNRRRNRCVMSTTSEWQYQDVSKLISSLGFKPTTIRAKGNGFKKDFNKWDIVFTPIENPFLIRNKDFNTIIKTPDKYSKYRYIKNIEIITTVPTKCLAVESDNHTYLAGYNLIKTHNTNKEIKTRGFKGEKMKRPLHHLEDCNFNHYALAISLYAYMLEMIGFKVRNTGLHHFNKLMKTPYLKKEVEAILENHIKKPLDVNSLV